MLDFEMREYEPLPVRRPAPPANHHPAATVAAALMLALGAVFGRISAFCTNAAQRWTDPATVRTWTRAVEHFRGVAPGAQLPRARWERLLLRFGSSLLMGIGGTLAIFWLLLFVGGTLAWLAAHGFGFALLFGAVLVGAIIGSHLALLGRFGADRERLN